MLFGFAIITARSMEEAKEIMAADPTALKGIQQGEIHPFSLGIRFFENLID